MSTSPLPEEDSIFEPAPMLPPHAREYIRGKIALIRDCVQRAMDGLDRDDADLIDWSYVTAQMVNAGGYADQAADQADVQGEALEDVVDPPDSPLQYPSSDPFLPLPGCRDDEGGAA